MTLRIGVDIGGTFTDLVAISSRRGRHDPQDRIHPARLRRGHHRRAAFAARGSAGRGQRRSARNDGGIECRAGGEGCENSADHHSGFSRHPGDPRPAHAGVVRHRLDQAARTGGTSFASGSDRKDAPGRIGGCSAGCGEPGSGDRHVACGERRQRRDLPAAQLCQSGSRAGGCRGGAGRVAGCGDFGQQRNPAGDQGVSAHQHDGHQRLRATGRACLHHRAGCEAARTGHRGAAATDAIERRPGLDGVRRGIPSPHHRIRSRRRRRRRCRPRPAPERATDHYVRHGRNDRQGRPGRERRGPAHRGDRGWRRGDGRITSAGGRRLYAEACRRSIWPRSAPAAGLSAGWTARARRRSDRRVPVPRPAQFVTDSAALRRRSRTAVWYWDIWILAG